MADYRAHFQKAVAAKEVLLKWRGRVPLEYMEIIDPFDGTFIEAFKPVYERAIAFAGERPQDRNLADGRSMVPAPPSASGVATELSPPPPKAESSCRKPLLFAPRLPPPPPPPKAKFAPRPIRDAPRNDEPQPSGAQTKSVLSTLLLEPSPIGTCGSQPSCNNPSESLPPWRSGAKQGDQVPSKAMPKPRLPGDHVRAVSPASQYSGIATRTFFAPNDGHVPSKAMPKPRLPPHKQKEPPTRPASRPFQAPSQENQNGSQPRRPIEISDEPCAKRRPIEIAPSAEPAAKSRPASKCGWASLPDPLAHMIAKQQWLANSTHSLVAAPRISISPPSHPAMGIAPSQVAPREYNGPQAAAPTAVAPSVAAISSSCAAERSFDELLEEQEDINLQAAIEASFFEDCKILAQDDNMQQMRPGEPPLIWDPLRFGVRGDPSSINLGSSGVAGGDRHCGAPGDVVLPAVSCDDVSMPAGMAPSPSTMMTTSKASSPVAMSTDDSPKIMMPTSKARFPSMMVQTSTVHLVRSEHPIVGYGDITKRLSMCEQRQILHIINGAVSDRASALKESVSARVYQAILAVNGLQKQYIDDIRVANYSCEEEDEVNPSMSMPFQACGEAHKGWNESVQVARGHTDLYFASPALFRTLRNRSKDLKSQLGDALREALNGLNGDEKEQVKLAHYSKEALCMNSSAMPARIEVSGTSSFLSGPQSSLAQRVIPEVDYCRLLTEGGFIEPVLKLGRKPPIWCPNTPLDAWEEERGYDFGEWFMRLGGYEAIAIVIRAVIDLFYLLVYLFVLRPGYVRNS